MPGRHSSCRRVETSITPRRQHARPLLLLQVQALQGLYGSFAVGQAPAVNRKKLFEVYNELDTLAGFDGLYAIEDRTVLGKE